MLSSQSLNNENKKGEEQMENDNSKLERIWSGIGWGLALILIGQFLPRTWREKWQNTSSR